MFRHDADIDHRTLQNARDLLAVGPWRHRTQVSQRFLLLESLDPTRLFTPTLMDKWIIRLGYQLRSWSEEPMLARYVMLIIQHQRTATCGEYEEALLATLYDRFSDVLWLARHRWIRDSTAERFKVPPSLYPARLFADDRL